MDEVRALLEKEERLWNRAKRAMMVGSREAFALRLLNSLLRNYQHFNWSPLRKTEDVWEGIEFLTNVEGTPPYTILLEKMEGWTDHSFGWSMSFRFRVHGGGMDSADDPGTELLDCAYSFTEGSPIHLNTVERVYSSLLIKMWGPEAGRLMMDLYYRIYTRLRGTSHAKYFNKGAE